jgi:DNA-binding response OmpR family regulator
MRILVVEDEEQIRKIIRLNLEIEGFEVISTDNGRKAIEIADNHHSRCDVARSKWVSNL